MTSGYKETTGVGGALMHKPCDIAEPWVGSAEQPHPGCPRACRAT